MAIPEGLSVYPVRIVLGAVAVILVVSLLVGLGPKRERPPDRDWNGMFYAKKDDRALFVPKRFGIGYTLNFGNPWAWVVLGVILAGVAAPLILTVVSLGRLPR
jgi:uncharacterized membrane protein